MLIPKIALAVEELDFINEKSQLFQGFEYTLDGILPHELAPTFFPGEVRFHCRKYGIGTSEDERALSYYCQKVREIAAMGRNYLTVHLGFSPEASWDKALKSLEELNHFAEKLGVTICLENLKNGWTAEPALLRKIIDTTGVRLTLDLGHLNSSDLVEKGELSTADFIELFKEDIAGVHVYEKEEERHLAPVDLRVLGPSLEALLKTSCNWWAIELDELEEIYRTRELLKSYLCSFTSS